MIILRYFLSMKYSYQFLICFDQMSFNAPYLFFKLSIGGNIAAQVAIINTSKKKRNNRKTQRNVRSIPRGH